jgi:hypothetical protein
VSGFLQHGATAALMDHAAPYAEVSAAFTW